MQTRGALVVFAACISHATCAEKFNQQRLVTQLGAHGTGEDDGIKSRTLSPIERKYLELVEMAVTGSLYQGVGECHPETHRLQGLTLSHSSCIVTNREVSSPFNWHRRLIGADWPTIGQTMIGHVRLRNIRMCIDRVVADNVPGDVAELGVWRGGATIYAKAVLTVLEQARRVHVFDVFSQMQGYAPGADSFLSTSKRVVRQNFDAYGLLDETIVFHPGLFAGSYCVEYLYDVCAIS